MGLIKAIAGAAGGVMADQWKEFFTCEALPADVLAVKGQKKTTRRSSNTHGDENIITSGSRIAVADGQCMLIVEQGKVVEVCAEPGEYTYDASTEPTIFAGNLGESIGQVFQNIGKRFTFGGEAPKDQRIYYFNTKELTGNKYGTPSPVPFRVVDQRAGIDIDIAIRCFGEYSYRITNPLLFYTNVCGNVTEDYTRDTIDGQLKSELLTALQPAFARISDMGIRYSSLPGHTREIAEALNEELSAQWRDRRGLEIVAFGVSSVKANEEDEQMIKEMQREAAYMDPTRAAAMLSRSQGEAMKAAASNTATGPAMAFMGMGMAGQMGGINAQNLYAMGQQQAAQQAKTRYDALAQALGDIPDLPVPARDVSGLTNEQAETALARTQALAAAVQSQLDQSRGRLEQFGSEAELSAKKQALAQRLDTLNERREALTLARQTLAQANAALAERFSPRLVREASEIFSELTGGRYARVQISRQMELEAGQPDAAMRRSLFLSGGTADELYLSVRLAVCRLLLPEDAPIVLDDALAMFDDDRLCLALCLLQREAANRQILLFNCPSRERRCLSADG